MKNYVNPIVGWCDLQKRDYLRQRIMAMNQNVLFIVELKS